MFKINTLHFRLLLMTVIPLSVLLMIAGYGYIQIQKATSEIGRISKNDMPAITRTSRALTQHDQSLLSPLNDTARLNYLTKKLKKSVLRAREIKQNTLHYISWFSFVTILIALFFNIWISHKIIESIKKAANIARKITHGERNVEIRVTSFDETGQLLQAMDDMQTSIAITEQSLEKKRCELEHLLQTDALTGVSNRRYLMDKLDEEVHRSQRYGRPLSVLMLDLDHFKKINDTFGHIAGDEVLKIIGKMLKENVRKTDHVSRYGGEEFNIMLTETSLDQAHIMAERLRHVIDEAHIFIQNNQRVDFTCSIGLAEYNINMRNPETLIALADEALYRAKKQGRNCVVTANELVSHVITLPQSQRKNA